MALSDPQPFSPEDLEMALQRSTLDPTKEESSRSRDASPRGRLADTPVEMDTLLSDPSPLSPGLRPRERLIAFEDGHP